MTPDISSLVLQRHSYVRRLLMLHYSKKLQMAYVGHRLERLHSGMQQDKNTKFFSLQRFLILCFVPICGTGDRQLDIH